MNKLHKGILIALLITLPFWGWVGSYAWGATLEGVTLSGVTVNPNMPSWWWPLEKDLVSTSSSDTYIGTVTHAGTNRTRVNPDTGLIEAVGANVARFESVGGHLATLIEPAGTNLVPFSEEFDNAAWTKTRATISADAVVAPDGTLTADKLVEDATAANSHGMKDTVAKESFTDNSDVTFSVYLKPESRTWVRLQLVTKASGYKSAYFNLATGAVGTQNVDDYGSESIRDGWWRYWVTMDIGSGATNPSFFITLAEANNDITIDGDGTSGFYIWGAMVQESPVPTSYIATSGAAVTRATESGEPHFTLPPDLFDSEGTAVVWWRPGYSKADVTTRSGIVAIASGSNNFSYHTNVGQLRSKDDVTDATNDANFTVNTWYKLIVKWGYLVAGVEKFRVGVDSGSGVVWGTEATFDGSYSLGTYLRLGYGLFGPMHMRQLSLFPTVLTDAEIDAWTGTP